MIFIMYFWIWLAASLLAILALLLLSNRARWQEWLAFSGIAVTLVIAWFTLHPIQTPLMGAAADVQAMIGKGKPVLLEFQSPY
jgi:peptidoglycan/LPS O-acetylase OafA/YrhL